MSEDGDKAFIHNLSKRENVICTSVIIASVQSFFSV